MILHYEDGIFAVWLLMKNVTNESIGIRLISSRSIQLESTVLYYDILLFIWLCAFIKTSLINRESVTLVYFVSTTYLANTKVIVILILERLGIFLIQFYWS